MFRSRRQVFRPKVVSDNGDVRRRNESAAVTTVAESTPEIVPTEPSVSDTFVNAISIAAAEKEAIEDLHFDTGRPQSVRASVDTDNKGFARTSSPTATTGVSSQVAKCSTVSSTTSLLACSSKKRENGGNAAKKLVSSATVEIDRSVFTMADLIRYTPKDDPTAVVGRRKKDSRKRQTVPSDDSGAAKETTPSSSAAPKVKVGSDGQMIVDEESLVMEQTTNGQADRELIDETGRRGFDHLFVKRKRTTKWWGDTETDKFYAILSATGTDFSLMQEFFHSRTRRELKLKFKKEDAINRGRIEAALKERKPLSAELYSLVSSDDDETLNESGPVPGAAKRSRNASVKKKSGELEITENASARSNYLHAPCMVFLEDPHKRMFDWIRSRMKGTRKKPTVDERIIRAGNPLFNAEFNYADNYIKTSKYNLLTFVPMNLFEQFQRLANFYFLILMVLQLIPQISSLSALTTILPLLAVLLVTALKDAVDDIQRHRSDRGVNNRRSKVIREGHMCEVSWQHVRVGDLLVVERDNFIAADLLLLTTSEPHGLVYVETAELDGETNLKPRQALPETSAMDNDVLKLSQFDGEVICEAPNNRLNSFVGRLKWQNQQFPLNNDQLLLRGCVLRNTKQCVGMVVFAGKDSKLMQNSGTAKFKRTSLDRFLNVLIIGIVVFLVSVCLICALLSGMFEVTVGKDFQAFLPWDQTTSMGTEVGSAAFIGFLTFFSYAILLNTVVPISLYVSVEIIRFAHSWMINWDVDLYYKHNDTAARARTTTLNEELGQIQYLFSDKTGTLTQNVMTFNKCSISGRIYGDTESGDGGKAPKPLDFSMNRHFEPKFRFFDSRLLSDTRSGQEDVTRFWRLLALCHTVMPDLKDDRLHYQAQSPDEDALTSAARNFGFVFKSRTPHSITIEVNDVDEVYEVVAILDFNNVRKRMSVLLKRDDHIYLYTKGADTLVLALLRDDPLTAQLKLTTQAHLDQFASEGLRTLVCAYKEVPPDFYASWKPKLDAAGLALDDRQSRLDQVYEEIERDLTLVGATAIEDKLQDGVPETIASLTRANVKIWVLTGDKQETAVNIGYSCRLLTDDLRESFVVDGSTFEEVQQMLESAADAIDESSPTSTEQIAPNAAAGVTVKTTARAVPQVVFVNSQADGGGADVTSQENVGLEGFALIITGQSLVFALDPRLEDLLVRVGCACKAVICCRVTPLQKALVVQLVRNHKKTATLAVGDGANDVSMIKTAHIGVGISGQEGQQAVLASDYSIAQFRYLEKLLLVHGRWSYYRMSRFLRYFFYKNFAFTLAHFWFAFFCGYTAQTIFDPVFIAAFNLIFTSLPVLALGVFDQDVNVKFSLRYPRLYVPGQFNLYFNLRIFIHAVLQGLLTSLVTFFVPFGVSQFGSSKSSGLDVGDLQILGFTAFTALVVTVTAQICLDTAYWVWLNHLVVWGSVAIYVVVALSLYEGVFLGRPDWVSNGGVAFNAATVGSFWFAVAIAAIVCTVPVVALRFFWFDTHPSLSDRVRVKQNLRRLASKPSELPLRSASSRSQRRRSLRSGYAFAHQQGFGDLITRGIAMR